MEHNLIEIRKGMYGLRTAVIIANERLVHYLAEFGYAPPPSILRPLHPRDIAFSLVVDIFGVKYVSREHAEHLVKTLQSLYIHHRVGGRPLLRPHFRLGLRRTNWSMPNYI